MTVLQRFLKYTAVNTTSDEHSDTTPSTPCQKDLAVILFDELKEMGLHGVTMDKYGYVYASLPATAGCEGLPTIGLIAHMDTAPDAVGENVKARVVRYDGGDLTLENGLVMKVDEYPALGKYAGQELVVTDGNTLLGADDKAGIAEIMAAVEFLKNNPQIPHGKVAVAFNPDEEIGRGSDKFDLDGFGAHWAYTVDGLELGEIEYENFNGAAAEIVAEGVNIHPGLAKDKMKNALLMINDIISALPEKERPEHTEGYEGFYLVTDVAGDVSRATMSLIIRDHNRDVFEQRKATLRGIVDRVNEKYGNRLTLTLKDSYYNMKEKIEPHMHIVERAQEAMKKCGVEPKIVAIRGGTDGAALSYKGLPCPNLSTGGANLHSVFEFIPVSALEKMTEILVEIVKAQ